MYLADYVHGAFWLIAGWNQPAGPPTQMTNSSSTCSPSLTWFVLLFKWFTQGALGWSPLCCIYFQVSWSIGLGPISALLSFSQKVVCLIPSESNWQKYFISLGFIGWILADLLAAWVSVDKYCCSLYKLLYFISLYFNMLLFSSLCYAVNKLSFNIFTNMTCLLLCFSSLHFLLTLPSFPSVCVCVFFMDRGKWFSSW